LRITEIRERSIPISRYADAGIPSGGLTTSIVAVVTDVVSEGRPVVGYGFASVGRYAQGGLIRERFAPRLLAAAEGELADEAGTNLDPFRAWAAMMKGEKPGGHGERCIAVGALDMAIWDAAAKLAGLPLHRFLRGRLGRMIDDAPKVRVYAAGGYYYPRDDAARLAGEMQRFTELGFRHAKIKIGGPDLARDLSRVEIAAATLPGGSANLAVDALNAYDAATGLAVASALAPLELWWFEDVCDPLDFDTQARIAARYAGPIAAGEALFSLAEARLLDRHGGLRPQNDVLVFDPVHCYGLPGYLEIVEHLTSRGWPRSAFWPHGGHLFSLQLAAALGLGGAEVNPFSFQPLCGLADDAEIVAGHVAPPEIPGIGFELRRSAMTLFRTLLAN
jgi:L-alanine-DL-glutamate epimerase-like enolase superfamily enzyme